MSGADKYFDQGDLIVGEKLRELFPFCVECKHRKNFRLEHVFMGAKDFLDYHRQVMDACGREGNKRTPMVVIRGQGGIIFASIPMLTVASLRYIMPDEAVSVLYRTTHLRWMMTDLDHMLQAIFRWKQTAKKMCLSTRCGPPLISSFGPL
jgi:hypothetical protein